MAITTSTLVLLNSATPHPGGDMRTYVLSMTNTDSGEVTAALGTSGNPWITPDFVHFTPMSVEFYTAQPYVSTLTATTLGITFVDPTADEVCRATVGRFPRSA